MSISLRLAILFALATAVVFAAVGMLFVHETDHSIDVSVDTSLSKRAPFIAHILEDHVFDYNRPFGYTGQHVPSGSYGPPMGQLLELSAGSVKVVNTLGLASSHSLISRQEVARAKTGQLFTDANIPGSQGAVRLLVEPVTLANYGQGNQKAILVVGISLGTGPATEHRVLMGVFLLLGPAALLAGIGAWLLARSALRPVEAMRSEADAISAHDSDARLPVPRTKDEIAALGHTMNMLLGRLQGALSAQRSFIADASHEIRTPMAILRTELELADKPGRSLADLQTAVSNALRESERISQLAQDLLLLARSDEHRLSLAIQPTDLGEVVRAAAGSAKTLASQSGVQLCTEISPDIAIHTVPVDPRLVRQSIDNLISNALRFSPAGSDVTIGVRLEDPITTVIEVSDSGPGFPADFLPYAFDRFRRPDGARARQGGGAGLGLSIVRSIAEAHGGWAKAENLEPTGAKVSIALPLASGRLL
ncbi:MAG: sensor histidine kinase [Acidimicrobiales bacterium]